MLRVKSLAAHQDMTDIWVRPVLCGLHVTSLQTLDVITRFRYVVPERGVKLILRLHDLGEESCLTFFIKRGVSTQPAKMISTFKITANKNTVERFYLLYSMWGRVYQHLFMYVQ